MQQVFEYGVLGILVGSIYALLAIGYTLVFGVLNKLNLAHGDIFMSGAFAAAYVAGTLSPWLVGIIGLAVPVVLGVVLFFLVFDPVRHHRELLGPAIGSQAFGLILASVASYLAGGYSLQFPTMRPHAGASCRRHAHFAAADRDRAVRRGGDAGLRFIVRHSKFGRSVRAIAEKRGCRATAGHQCAARECHGLCPVRRHRRDCGHALLAALRRGRSVLRFPDRTDRAGGDGAGWRRQCARRDDRRHRAGNDPDAGDRVCCGRVRSRWCRGSFW